MKLGIVHDYCECHRPCIFNDDILSSNIPFLSVFLSKKEKQNKQKKKKKKNRKIKITEK